MDANNFISFCIAIIFILILFLVFDIKSKFDFIKQKRNKNLLIDLMIFIGVLFLLYALVSPFLSPLIYPLTKIESNKHQILNPNETGDALGGTMAPFIGITGVIFTFLAFYMQKVANEEIREQFKVQQFESQFYEMLRLHKENVNEIEVVAKDVNLSIDKSEEINITGNLSILKHNFKLRNTNSVDNLRIFKGREAFRVMKNEFEIYYSEARTIKQNNITINDFEDAYELFFWGVRAYSRQDKRNLWEKFEPEDFINKLQKRIETLMSEKNTDDPLNDFFNHETLKEVVLGNGYSSHLGHYYRHLYHTVKFVVENKSLTYFQKRNYLKILRGQLSNYEQIMLFYNWLGGYGGDWENKDNSYFTQYKMLHNLWYTEMNLDNYIKEKLQELVRKYENFKITDDEIKALEDGKSLFEGGDKTIVEFFKQKNESEVLR